MWMIKRTLSVFLERYHSKPIMTESPSNMTVVVGDNATLTCTVLSDLNAMQYWVKSVNTSDNSSYLPERKQVYGGCVWQHVCMPSWVLTSMTNWDLAFRIARPGTQKSWRYIMFPMRTRVGTHVWLPILWESPLPVLTSQLLMVSHNQKHVETIFKFLLL